MSTFTSEPGVRLGGRYRLEDRLAAAGGWSAWKAIDEILARPVSVITFASGFPRLEQAVTAARAASRLTDTRLTQVFDVEDSWDHAYIVMEWPVGDTLADLVAADAVEPFAGARIVAEVAAALAGAHAAGLAHLCLRPDTVRWTPGGGVKVTGLGIDAVLSGLTADDPQEADTRGLGKLMYTVLTGMWPGDDFPELPAAPESDGQTRRPRQVRAGVPAILDEITSRALALPGRDSQEPLGGPADVSRSLKSVLPPLPLPLPASTTAPARGQRGSGDWPGPAGSPDDSLPAAQTRYDRPRPADHGRRAGRTGRTILITLVVLIAIAGASAAALRLLHKTPGAPSPGRSHTASGSTSPVAQPAIITPSAASGFDALNPADSYNENAALAKNVLDGAPAGWHTQYYDSAHFGGLKAGTGMIIDLGKPTQVTSLTVQFGSTPGADVQIKVGNSAARSAANLNSMITIASKNDVSGSTTFTAAHPVTARYLVIWFTKLPPLPGQPGHYEAQILPPFVIHGTS